MKSGQEGKGIIGGGLRTKGLHKKSWPGRPLVSIITAVYNGEMHLEQTILSVLGQSYNNFEYIVVDGGSTDTTLDIIKRYEDRIDYWLSGPDNGIYDAMNKGIALSVGDIVGIINSDDYYLECTIEKIVSASASESEAGVFHGDMIFRRANGVVETWRSKKTLKRSDAYHMPINHPTAFVRSECYTKYGNFDAHYKVAADYDLIMRYLFDYNVKFCYIKEPLVVMREGGKSGSYSMTTHHDGIEILSKRGFSLFIKTKFSFWYLWLVLMQFLKKNAIMRSLFSLYNRTKFSERA